MSIPAPPIYERITNEEGKTPLPWILFFNNIHDGDSGVDWNPNFVSLTTVGTPTITARYYKLSKYLVFFRITITPSTSTTAVAGTTYIDNFPISFTSDGACLAVTGGLGSAAGHIVASAKRIYVPAWTAVTVPLTIIGVAEAQ